MLYPLIIHRQIRYLSDNYINETYYLCKKTQILLADSNIKFMIDDSLVILDKADEDFRENFYWDIEYSSFILRLHQKIECDDDLTMLLNHYKDYKQMTLDTFTDTDIYAKYKIQNHKKEI